MFTSLVYNINVATSITSQGRSLGFGTVPCRLNIVPNAVTIGSLSAI